MRRARITWFSDPLVPSGHSPSMRGRKNQACDVANFALVIAAFFSSPDKGRCHVTSFVTGRR
ncbi:MAG: hypothetical protein WEE20_01595, partial [Bacteroidota bacterium]